MQISEEVLQFQVDKLLFHPHPYILYILCISVFTDKINEILFVDCLGVRKPHRQLFLQIYKHQPSDGFIMLGKMYLSKETNL